MFTPNLGEMIQFDEHIIQMGWFNHQHEKKRNGSAGGKSLQLPETNIFAPENDGFQVRNLLFQGGGMNFLHGNKSDFPNNDLGRSSSKIKLTEKCGFLFLVVFSLDPLKSFKKLREPNLKRFENLSSVYGRPGNLRTTLSPQMPTPSPRNKAFRSPTPLKINMEPKDRPIEQEHYLPNLHF